MFGIVLSTFGVVLLFYYGLSPYLKQQERGYVFLYRKDVINNPDSKENIKKEKYKFRSKIGLYLCISGGIFQFLALFVQIFIVHN